MPTTTADRSLNRRRALSLFGAISIPLAATSPVFADAQQTTLEDNSIRLYPTVASMKRDISLQRGEYARTLGFLKPGDGGEALYRVGEPSEELSANDADIIAIAPEKHAYLLPGTSVNYRMFGAVGDGKNDDGVQIKRAHQFANRYQLPIVNRSGEFWIRETVEIPIVTNVVWGNTQFHIDERFNQKRQGRFVVESLFETKTVELDADARQSLLNHLKPGVQLIPELADYPNHLISIIDKNDRIGFRSGYEGQSWAREELFYVEEDGRVIGDIAWQFNDYTSLVARPCDPGYLTIEGGTFFLSGDNPGEKYTGYYANGFQIRRSRTIIRDQWMGLEPGKRDISMEPRSGFYSFSHVFDCTLENVRLIPWEQNRADPSKEVGAGTYGIGGSRMLQCTFRNVTAEGSWLHWGVFGTNLNKDFRIDHCRLNRVDVHFHCWNLSIKNSVIGLRGISVTGGGQLTIENTTRHGSTFVNFRRDFGAKWDGDIRIRNCRLVADRDRTISVLYSRPSDSDYGYPIGCGRTIDIENLDIDFSNGPDSDAPIWLLNVVSFSKTKEGGRLFFPTRIAARNVQVTGRANGIRLLHLPQPYQYRLNQTGGYDGVQLDANCSMHFENIHLETFDAQPPGSSTHAHLVIGDTAEAEYADARALYPDIRLIKTHGLRAYLGGSAANLSVMESDVEEITADVNGPLRGRLQFRGCTFTPNAIESDRPHYALETELGTYLSDCTLHAPRMEGTRRPDRFDQIDFVQINKRVRFFHSNTALGNEVLSHLAEQEVKLTPAFIAMLKSHHALETDEVASGQ